MLQRSPNVHQSSSQLGSFQNQCHSWIKNAVACVYTKYHLNCVCVNWSPVRCRKVYVSCLKVPQYYRTGAPDKFIAMKYETLWIWQRVEFWYTLKSLKRRGVYYIFLDSSAIFIRGRRLYLISTSPFNVQQTMFAIFVTNVTNFSSFDLI